MPWAKRAPVKTEPLLVMEMLLLRPPVYPEMPIAAKPAVAMSPLLVIWMGLAPRRVPA